MMTGGLKEADDELGRALTTHDEVRAARELGCPVGFIRVSDAVRFRGYYWRGGSAPGTPNRQYMVDAVYDVRHGKHEWEVSVRSWSTSGATPSFEEMFGFDSLVAIHAMDFLHSASSVPTEDARALTRLALKSQGDGAETAMILVGDVRCELRHRGEALVTVAVRPAVPEFDVLLQWPPPSRGATLGA